VVGLFWVFARRSNGRRGEAERQEPTAHAAVFDHDREVSAYLRRERVTRTRVILEHLAYGSPHGEEVSLTSRNGPQKKKKRLTTQREETHKTERKVDGAVLF